MSEDGMVLAVERLKAENGHLRAALELLRAAIEKHHASWQDEGEISVSRADQELWAVLDTQARER